MGNPTYVERGGEQVFVPPFIAEGVQFFSFVVRADRGALQAVCDRYLNGPGRTDVFVPALSQVMFVFNRLEKLFAKQSPWRERGVYTEQEAAVWMLVRDRQQGRTFWFHPYMIVDSAYAMAMGREVYGFPKNLGWFEVPDGPATPRSMSVTTTVVQKFGADVPAIERVLITARAVGQDASDDKGDDAIDFGSIEELADSVVRQLKLEEDRQGGRIEADVIAAVRLLQIPMVFLKEFRDGSDTTGACFQTIETSRTAMTRFHGARAYLRPFEIILEDVESHPIRAELGLPGGPIPVMAASWAKFDFEIGPCN